MLAFERVRVQRQAGGTPLMSFHSLQRSLVTPRCLALPRDQGCPASTFAVHAVFRSASATRIRLESRSLAALLDDFSPMRRAARRGSCIAAFLALAMFRYPQI